MRNPLNQKESDVEKGIVKYAKSQGWLFRKQQGQGNRGKADRMFLKNGVCVFLEIKRPGSKPTIKQMNEIRLMHDNGFPADWVDNIADGKAALDFYDGNVIGQYTINGYI